MALKPKNIGNNSGGERSNESYVPVDPPRAGLRKARISLVVELGEQNQDPIWEKNGKAVKEGTEGAEEKPRLPVDQVAIFADLVNDRRDYGGEIGEQPYRIMLNGEFAGKIKGYSLKAVAPRDADGDIIKGRPNQFHPTNPMVKLAKACNREDIITEMDVEEFLNLPFMADIEVKKTESKTKKDKNDEPVVYTNVNFKGAAKVPLDDNDEPTPVAELSMPPLCISFSNATKDTVKFIKYSVRKYIKGANNYEGSKMQAAIEAYEAELAAKKEASGDKDDAPAKPAAKAAPAKKTPAKTKAPVTPVDDSDEDAPF